MAFGKSLKSRPLESYNYLTLLIFNGFSRYCRAKLWLSRLFLYCIIVFRLVPKLSGFISIYINLILSLASCFMVANWFFPGNWLFVLPLTPPRPVSSSHPLPPSWPHRFPCHTCRTPRNWKANEASVIIIMRASKSAHYDNNSVPNAWPVGFFQGC